MPSALRLRLTHALAGFAIAALAALAPSALAQTQAKQTVPLPQAHTLFSMRPT